MFRLLIIGLSFITTIFLPYFTLLKKDLGVQRKIHLSRVGRIAAIKMIIVPKFNFLFQAVLIYLGASRLKEWHTLLE